MFTHNQSKTRIWLRAVALICLTTLTSAPAFAIGGGKKTPAEQALEDMKNAVKIYNSGVEHMAKAREYGEASDSLFAFNYRATNDAKARREYEKAVERFSKAIELNPAFCEAYSNKGYCLRKLGDNLESLAVYHIALEINAGYAPAIEYQGEAFLGLDSLDSANRSLAKLQSMADSATVDSLKVKYAAYADTLTMSIERFKLTQFKSGETKK